MATGWLKGVVKSVQNGDTLVIMGGARPNGPPLEKTLTLSSLIAPRLGKRDGSTPDEPYAWGSREFLRQLTVGKACTFKVDYVLENVPGREFGSVFIAPKSENVAVAVVSNGWAKIRPAGGQQSPYYEQLAAAQAIAEGQSLGIWNKSPDALAKAVRPLSAPDVGVDAAEFIKGTALPAIVEQVGSGSTLRVTLLDKFRYVTVLVCGIQCPSMGRRAPAGAVGDSAAAEEVPPEPFALQARHFVETRVLQREVRVMFQGVDKFGNLIGSVVYPVENELTDLAQGLVKAGLAKTVEWGLNMMGPDGEKLRNAERAAKAMKTGQWVNWVPPPSNQTKLSDKFTGTVVEVVSGDCIVVRDSASNVERRVNLSSIRAPRIMRRGEQSEPWAVEAKEFLRTRLIGKDVSVSMEYNRKVGGPEAVAAAAANGSAAPSAESRVMSFGSVSISEKDPGGVTKQSNVAELLLIRGLASTVKHRTDEERSAHYEALLEAEGAGRSKKKGVFGNKEPNVHHFNDLTVPGAASRAKGHLPFLQRGKQTGVVEHILSAHKLKVMVPKEGVTIAFSPAGVRAPQGARPPRPGMPATKEEPYWQEALALVRRHFMQREVELEVETCDRVGTFIGTLRLAGKPLNLGLALLEAGLGKLQPNFDPDRTHQGRELLAAEAAAKEARLKVWEGYEPPSEVPDDAAEVNGTVNTGSEEFVYAVVTDMRDATDFSIQMDKDRVEYIGEQLQLTGESGGKPPGVLKVGDKCAAQFTLDDLWYRALVAKVVSSDPVNPKYDVVFVDYGNSECLPATRIRMLDPGLEGIQPQAVPASLAYVKVSPADKDENGQDAAMMLNQLTSDGRALQARIEWTEGPASNKGWGKQAVKPGFTIPPRAHVILCNPDTPGLEQSFNTQLVAAGYAKVAEPRNTPTSRAKEVLEVLEKAQGEAHRRHLGMWEYGDPDSEDEAEAPPKPARAWGGKR